MSANLWIIIYTGGQETVFLRLMPRKSFVGKKNALYLQCFSPDGGIGRRTGLKIQRPQGCAGSTPAPGTEAEKV